MAELETLFVEGMHWHQDLLWLTCPKDSLVLTYDPRTQRCEERFYFPAVSHACPSREGVWLTAGGGTLGQQLILFSLEKKRVERRFDCPDGAASGVTVLGNKLWLSHRRNRKLFCLDLQDGRILWTIRAEKQIFSPTTHQGDLWAIQCDPGPLGDWSDESQGRYFFVKYDCIRERVTECIPVSLVPACLAVSADRFWYALRGQQGLGSQPKASLNPRTPLV